MKKEKKSKLTQWDKIGIALFSLAIMIILVYTLNRAYQNNIGEIVTETVVTDTYVEVAQVQGFAVRDEAYYSGETNLAILNKQEGKVYVPVIDDGENVAKNGVVAIAFDTQKQADNYREVQQLKTKLAVIKNLQSNSDIEFSDVLDLNAQTGSNIREYIGKISSGNTENLSALTENIASTITSKQIAVGEEIDLSAVIEDYNKQIAELEKTYSTNNKIVSTFAGYFVSSVDGYENVASYADIKDKKDDSITGEKLLSAEAEAHDKAYGKIISRHTWYYIFDINRKEFSDGITGNTVSVSFEELGIDNLNMTVYNITSKDADVITVTLKCTSLNDTIVKIRKEVATITTKEYTGFRISSEALDENEDGLEGVYVLVGNIIKFAPLDVKYYGDGFIIAVPYTPQAKEDETPEEEAARKALYVLKQYDNVIVKGINLDYGIILS